MRYPAILLLGLFTVAVAIAAEPAGVTPIPPPKSDPWTELKCDVNAPIVLSAGDAKMVAWRLIDEGTGASLTTVPGSTSAVFITSKAGRYRFVSIGDGKPEWCAMTAGSVPNPPGPPDPPQPVDEFIKSLQVAYKADTSTEKAADLAQLAAVYLEAVNQADRAEFTTAAELFAAVRKVAMTLIPDGRLAGVRLAIAADLAKVLPMDPDALLTADLRKTASTAFNRYAKALQGVIP